MGVLTDYFRAPDARTVVNTMERLDDDSPVVVPHSGLDHVDAKGVDSAVVLGQLIAIIKAVPWSADLVEQTTVWPTTPLPGPDGPTEDDPWATGPWVTELDDAVRDSLAAVADTDLPGLVAQWARVEELYGAHTEDLLPLAEELVGLARRARDADERLYCWTCL